MKFYVLTWNDKLYDHERTNRMYFGSYAGAVRKQEDLLSYQYAPATDFWIEGVELSRKGDILGELNRVSQLLEEETQTPRGALR